MDSHELYNLGHLYEAAVAHYQATGKRTLLDVALRTADLLDRTFGPGKQTIWPGHQITEMGLVKLYRVTGDARYLSLAKFLLDARGPDGSRGARRPYNQSQRPVVRAERGHGPRRARDLHVLGHGRRGGPHRRRTPTSNALGPHLARRRRPQALPHGRHRRDRRTARPSATATSCPT